MAQYNSNRRRTAVEMAVKAAEIKRTQADLHILARTGRIG